MNIRKVFDQLILEFCYENVYSGLILEQKHLFYIKVVQNNKKHYSLDKSEVSSIYESDLQSKNGNLP